ncbi:MAG: hypothetical protein KKB03_01240 [Nanoarchaeota archaeon]|nr:hypothetical protein [Nanoarchaeota archaeon]MBU1135231.1 hypothetical protein [Nanoarchaeota archaeon]MBU2519852.1 hypothetical protein [Nanoarchaeota archaeon]
MFEKKNEYKNMAAHLGIFGFIVFLTGIVWFGTEMSWWNITFPYLPFLVLLFGLGMMCKAKKHCCKK